MTGDALPPVASNTDSAPLAELLRIREARERLGAEADRLFKRHCRAFSRRWQSEADTIVRVDRGLSDCHCGNRTVVRVRLASGRAWFYKPRDGRYDAAWNAFLKRWNRTMPALSLRALEVHRRANHFWVEGVDRRAPQSLSDRRMLFVRAGSLLYLLHILLAVDCHRDNVVFDGAHPVLVDCETLLHPNARVQHAACTDDESLIETGFLPALSYPHARSASALSALLVDKSSAEKRESSRYFFAGFEAAHTALWCHPGDRLFRDLVRALRSGNARYIRRPTAEYYRILRESMQFRLLQDTSARAEFLRERCRVSASDAVARKEAASLIDFDIPRFEARPAKPRPRPTMAAMRDASRVILRAFA